MPPHFDHRAPIVIDLEATCWSEDEPERRAVQSAESEIIEIGAVRLDPRTLASVGEFQTFVRPRRHPVLSGFCTGLTSITQAMVDAAPNFPEAMAGLRDWLGDEPVILCAWGRYERTMFRRCCAEAGVENPFAGAYLNIKEEFARWARGQGLGRLRLGMAGALEVMGLPLVGTHHRGIDDARMIAGLLRALRDPARMSPEARLLLGLAAERAPKATHRGHASDAARARGWQSAGGPRAWWPRVCQELERLGLADSLPGGRGLALTVEGLVIAVELTRPATGAEE